MPGTVWKGHLSFGLVSIPVRLYKAARPERVRFRRLERRTRAEEEVAPPEPETAPSRGRRLQVVPPPEPAAESAVIAPVRHAALDAQDRPVERENLVRGVEVAPRQYVVVEEEEMRAITPSTSTEMAIVEFVALGEIDPLYFETSYWVAPEEAGAKAYAMLFQALRNTGRAALAEVAMHRREHVAVLRPSERSLVMHTMFYDDEVRRETEPEADLALVSPKELELAETFVRALEAKFEPGKFRDKYREKLKEMIAGRGPSPAAEAPEAPPAPAADLMAALQESLRKVQPNPEPVAPKKRPAGVPAAARNRRRKSGG